MPRPIFRSDLQRLARQRVRDARVLLQNKNYSGSYYFSGIAVEIAIKACIAKATQKHEFPAKNAAKVYQHDLNGLVNLAGLANALQMEIHASPAFQINWSVVKDWTVDSRYEFTTKIDAEDMYSAVVSRKGVMQWIRKNW